jgi:hypothetical protein
VAAIMAQLEQGDIATLDEMADDMNKRGERCLYGGVWTATLLLRAIVERVHGHLERISTRS